ncbi:MarR family winged helix-turn-helix transcriptional regulator [Streptomyces brasiliensis]|uniref:Transcriptional regulator n=1 Tax=Streptomyces brasiliensis TaxID=1954 RepID=A0A917P4N7_9ACTN|nr:MarR family winged helix-turn-helix transcriptional regulator [Streptomyces brasiliensis]GGJ61454.1 transcriptional regulator [Streptomyces brasiliensis]
MKSPGAKTGEGSTLITRWRALARLHRRIEGAVERRLHEELGLSLREFESLEVLHHGATTAGGRLYLQDLAAEIVLSQSATSGLVTRLQGRGLISIATASHDRRSVDVYLTPVAREVLRRGTPLVAEAVRHAVQALDKGADPALLRCLQEVAPGGWRAEALSRTADL